MPLVNGLPDFIKFGVERKIVQIVETDVGYHPADEPDRVFELPSGAYDHIQDSDREPAFPEAGFKRHEYLSDDEREGDGGRNGMFFEDSMRLLLNHRPHQDQDSAESSYAAYLGLAERYRKKPKSFYRAYKFVSSHPLFWLYSTSAKGDIFWDYFGFTQMANPLSIYKRKGKVTFLIEPTFKEGHLWTPETSNVLDTNLVVSAKSYEAVIVALAARLDAHYDDTGAAREDVPDTEYTQRLLASLDSSNSNL